MDKEIIKSYAHWYVDMIRPLLDGYAVVDGVWYKKGECEYIIVRDEAKHCALCQKFECDECPYSKHYGTTCCMAGSHYGNWAMNPCLETAHAMQEALGALVDLPMTILPCPHCGSDSHTTFFTDKEQHIRCLGCNFHLITKFGEKEAICRWNNWQ